MLEFALTPIEEIKFKNWDKKHTACRGQDGAIGGRLTFSFTPTGLGTIIKVRCSICKREIDLTDTNNW
jgi:hypothetical protein